MPLEQWEAYANSIVRDQPDPPRRYDWKMLRLIFQDRVVGWWWLFTLFGGLVIIGFLLFPGLNPGYRMSRVILSVFGFSCCFFIGFIMIWAKHVALRSGQRGTAYVIELAGDSGRNYRPNATYARLIKGQWEVRTATRSFTQEFVLYQPWAVDVGRGSAIRVLVHPTWNKVWMELDR